MTSSQHFNIVANAIRYIDATAAAQPNLDQIADHVHLSKFHLQRVFKRWAGVSPKQFLQALSLEQAKQSLRDGRSTLIAAQEAGLSGNGRLHDLFVRLEGVTPGEFSKRGNHLTITISQFESPFGVVCCAETAQGINQLVFSNDFAAWQTQLSEQYPLAKVVQGRGAHVRSVQGFFANWSPPERPVRLDLQGTEFQLQVWKALLSIPSGQHLSYQDLAKAIDKPRAARAVGTAIGSNPVAYLIPCHRVIKGTGVSGGYRWGEERKRCINAYERLRLAG